ncbi:MAG TPA: SpoIIE family protein phosphatase [Acidimicrobiales bacterium]|nr:SpoIIE family protein phosphatase [Acidimicrobiales bacterium]
MAEAGVRTSRRSTSPLLVAYIAVLAGAAAAVAVALAAAGVAPPGRPSWPALLVLGALLVAAEYLFVRFRYRGDVNALNLVESVLAPLLFAFPGPVVVATVAAAQAVGGMLRRNEPVKAAFNVAQWSLAAAVGATLVALLEQGSGTTPENLAAMLVVLAVVGLVNQLAFATVLGFVNRRPLPRLLQDIAPIVLPGWVLGWAVNSLIGLLFVLAYAANPVATLLFAVPLVMLHLAYRGYAGARSDRVRLTGLHRAARALAAPIDPGEAVEAYLREVATCFEAAGAALVLRTDAGLLVHRLLVNEGFSVEAQPHGTVTLESALVGQPGPLRVTAGAGDPLADLLARSGRRDCLSAPLVEEERITGALLVYDQAGLEGFEAGELAVLEALARETVGTFAKGRLLAAILEERRKLALIVHTTSDGILTLAEDGTVLSWNPALERLTGVPASEVVGTSARLQALRPRREGGGAVDLSRWAGGEPLPPSLLLFDADGEPHRLSCSYSEAHDDEGGTRTLVVVARDVTPAEEIEELRQEAGRLAEAEAAQRMMVEQLRQAFVPAPLEVDGVQLGLSFLASDEEAPTGGDLYDWQRLPSGELHLAVIDVMGHGVAATKDALRVVHALRLLSVQECPLEELIVQADRLLGMLHPDLVATVVVARYRPSDGRVRIAGGGHPPALRITGDGEVTLLGAPGGAIGWPGAGSERIVETRLADGDALVLYTDGLVEARKDLLEGMETLARNAGVLGSIDADRLAVGLLERSLAGAARRDDSLVLVLRRVPTAAVPDSMRWSAPPDARRVAGIRRELRAWLGARGVDGEAIDELVVVAGELLANAVAAARSSVHLRASGGADRVVLEVEDDGRGHEHLASFGHSLPTDAAERGRGLFLVRQLVDDMAVLSTSEGSVVTVTRVLSRVADRTPEGSSQ